LENGWLMTQARPPLESKRLDGSARSRFVADLVNRAITVWPD
jgi:hypothetical protein